MILSFSFKKPFIYTVDLFKYELYCKFFFVLKIQTMKNFIINIIMLIYTFFFLLYLIIYIFIFLIFLNL